VFELEKRFNTKFQIHYEQKYDCCPVCGAKIVKDGPKPRTINGREVSVQHYKCKKKKRNHTILKLNWVIS
jgi:hypothetical protein